MAGKFNAWVPFKPRPVCRSRNVKGTIRKARQVAPGNARQSGFPGYWRSWETLEKAFLGFFQLGSQKTRFSTSSIFNHLP
jgi:hypothetical protein